MVSFLAMVLFVSISTFSSNHLWVTASFVLADFCLVIIVLGCFSICIDIGGDRVSTITGIMNFCGQSGAFLMSLIFGKLVDLTHSYETPQYLMLIILTVGGACWIKIDASKKLIVDSHVDLVLSPIALKQKIRPL